MQELEGGENRDVGVPEEAAKNAISTWARVSSLSTLFIVMVLSRSSLHNHSRATRITDNKQQIKDNTARGTTG